MPRGSFPVEYQSDPYLERPLERTFHDLDGYTQEIFQDEEELFPRVAALIPLPPLVYEGRYLKGVLLSQAVNLLLSREPRLNRLFHLVAVSKTCSYPWSTGADGLMTLYENPLREEWFRRTHPERARQALIPMQSADYVHEYLMAPQNVSRDLDVLCVSRLWEVKNLPMIARALRVYKDLFGPVRLTLVTGSGLDRLEPGEQRVWRSLVEVLGDPRELIDFVGFVPYEQMPGFYSRARALVLGSLLEGKNRALHEAMSCNTPVVYFSAFNRDVRGPAPVVPEGAGLGCEFDPESLAETLHVVLSHPGELRPRRRYLESGGGRGRFLSRCLDCLPYYREELPGHREGEHHRNLWLDLAVQHNYQLGLHDYLYDRNPTLSCPSGLERVSATLEFYLQRFAPVL